jgi:hypothetical protein
MKKFTSILSIMAVSAVFSTSALAQASATATTGSSAATITPITIIKGADLTFGTFAANGAGSIVVSPTTLGYVADLKVTVSTNKDLPTPASFKVSGEALYTYDFSIGNAGADIVLSTGTGESIKTLTISGITTSLTVGTVADQSLAGTLDAEGKQTVYLGGTLTILAPITSAATYINESAFVAVVNYN